MSYQSRDLSVLSYANGFTLWHYATPDSTETILADGYFDPAADMLRSGDMIVANLRIDGEARCGFLTVTRSGEGSVSLAVTAALNAAP